MNSMFVGTKNLSINATKLEVIIKNALKYLKNLQISENTHWKNMTELEILNEVEYVEITSLGTTGYQVEVMLSNSIGEIFTQSIIL